MIPQVPLSRVLRRVDAIWGPDGAPHHLVYGQTGSGKTTLIKALLGLCPYSRVLIMDPKPNADPHVGEPVMGPGKHVQGLSLDTNGWRHGLTLRHQRP